MIELTPNTSLALDGGGSATVIKELGRGGQGIVYLVNVNGAHKALKWYINPPNDNFYHNLQYNIAHKAPSPAFLWPEQLTLKQRGSYGYIMGLRPQNYHEFGHFLINKVAFKSFSAVLSAAMKICEGFKMLHLLGYSYQDLNDGNFFINPDTGDVLICDNDNVMAHGDNSGIMGKARFMAPEVVAGKAPDKYSDRYSLALLLFMLFYFNHPLEGARVAACPCMTEAHEKRFYGSEALFIYDPHNKSNLPVPGLHNNVIKRWPRLPAILRDAFTQEFSHDCLTNPTKRRLEQDWQRILFSVRDSLILCPHCSEESFVNISSVSDACMECKRAIDLSKRLAIGSRLIPLVNKKHIFFNDDTPHASVTSDANGFLLVVNNSSDTWVAETPSGKTKNVAPNDFFPVKPGIKLNIKVANDTYKAEVKSLSNN